MVQLKLLNNFRWKETAVPSSFSFQCDSLMKTIDLFLEDDDNEDL